MKSSRQAICSCSDAYFAAALAGGPIGIGGFLGTVGLRAAISSASVAVVTYNDYHP